MSLTVDQHRRIGEILGYPSCCVEAFVADRSDSDSITSCRTRGLISLPDRSSGDRERVGHEVSALLGRPWSTSARFRYVPCASCAATSPDYRSYEGDCEFELAERQEVS